MLCRTNQFKNKMATGGRDQWVAKMKSGRDQQVARVEFRVESRWAAARWVESSRIYEEDNTVDEGLLNQLKGWIMYNRLPTLTRHLGFKDTEITRIMLQESTPED